jgi:hypothetical protein
MMIHSTPAYRVGDRVTYAGELATVIHGNTCDPDWCPGYGYGHATINIRFDRDVSRRMSQQQDVYATSVTPA